MYGTFACKAADTKFFFAVIDFDVSIQRFHLQRQAAVIHTMRKLLSCCPCCCCFYLSFLFQNLKPIQKPLEASYYGGKDFFGNFNR